MRKIINSTYVTLDGVVGDPQEWSLPYFGEDAQKYAYDLLFSSGALLLGRRTYEGFASTWPHMEEQTGEYGVRMNTLPKYAVSTTLEKADWNNTSIISSDVTAEVARLKEQPGQDILQYGFGELSRTLVEAGLLDELRLWVHPVFAGLGEGGDRLIGAESFNAAFELADTLVLGTGVVVHTYRKTAPAA